MEQKKEDIYMVTATIIGRLQAQEELSTGKAALAALRHSIGKPLGEVPAVWSILFEDMPEKFLSCNGKETKAERAIYAALQLYAVQKQGRRGKENSDVAKNIGEALHKLRLGTEQKALDKRFNASLAAVSFEAFIYQLRQLMKLAKAKGALPLDFAALAHDLYYYQLGYKDRICLRWAESYYRISAKKAAEAVQGKNEEE